MNYSFQSAVEINPISSEMRSTTKTSDFLFSFVRLLYDNLGKACDEYMRDAVFIKKVGFLKDMINRLYHPDTQEYSLEEALVSYPDSYKNLWKSFPRDYILPFLKKEINNGKLQEPVELDLRYLMGPCHAISDDNIISVCGGNNKIKRFVIEIFSYTPIDFAVYKSFKDKTLESLYSNDEINLSKTEIRLFADFFVSGDGNNYADYDPSKYYGGTPISEDYIKAFLKGKGLSNNSITKLIAIMKISRRFYCEKIDSKDCFCLKTQYLNNTQAYSVAILYKEGKPLHLEEIHSRIVRLEKQFPGLVEAPSLSSMQLRRKPVIDSSGSSGQRRLMIWGKAKSQHKIDAYNIIRSFVEKEFEKNGEPVSFDSIEKEVQSYNLYYPQKTLRTYCTTVCTSVRGKGFIPQGAGDGDKRLWIRRLPELQRIAASNIFESKRGLTYKEIMEKINEKGLKVQIQTLKKAIEQLPDVFVKGKIGIKNVFSLSDTIRKKSDIKAIIPDNEKCEKEEREVVKQKIIHYLFSRPDYRASQKDITIIFEKDLKGPVSSRKALIRRLMDNQEVFVKEKIEKSSERLVSINPLYVERMNYLKQFPQALTEGTNAKDSSETEYDYAALRAEIVKRESKFFEDVISDSILPSVVDEMIGIMKMDKDEFPASSPFIKKELLWKLYRFYCQKTFANEREDLRDSLLMLAECYLKNYSMLVHNKQYDLSCGLGAVIYDLASFDDLPPKVDKSLTTYLSKYDFKISKQVYNVVINDRNSLIGHPGNTIDRSEHKVAEGISACIHTFLHIAWRRMIHTGKLPYSSSH